MRTLSCFIVEDSPVIRDNLIETLEEMVPVRVCGTAESESDALDALRRQSPQPDLVIIDIFLKAGSAWACCSRRASTATAVIWSC